MKSKTNKRPTVWRVCVFRQICNLIPGHLVPALAREHGIDKQARSFSAWSHVLTLMFAQFTRAIGLNDVCDSLRLHAGLLGTLRGASGPSRNALSHANKHRPAEMAQALMWKVLEHLETLQPQFGGRGGRTRLVPRFKKSIQIVDSTTISLIAQCMDWASHRRRKAAAKCHVRLDMRGFLPQCVILGSGREADAPQAPGLCAALQGGEIVIFDRAYFDLIHLQQLNQRGVFWVMRAKETLRVRVVQRLQRPRRGGYILRDDIVEFVGQVSRSRYPTRIRRVTALVEVEGKMQEMTFLTNHLQWAASSVADLYKCRWQIEVFFKQIKQVLQLSDFLGNSANAVRWQLWTALLVYILLRFQSFQSRWASSFVRLWAVVRSALWLKIDLRSFLASCGTAGGSFRLLGQPEQAYLPGFAPTAVGQPL